MPMSLTKQYLASQHTPSLSIFSSVPSTTPTSLPSPSLSVHEDINSPDFVSRVSHLPLVGTALRAYEQGKASSRVVKVSDRMVICTHFHGRLTVHRSMVPR